MHPSTYRGDAAIDGDHIDAVLQLDSYSLSLSLPSGQEVLRWPIETLQLERIADGTYEVRHRTERFVFSPAADDGLDAELRLRRRSTPTESPETVALAGGDVIPVEPGPRTGRRQRHSTAGSRRSGPARLFEGRDLGARTAVGVLAALAGAVLLVASFSEGLTESSAIVVVTGAENEVDGFDPSETISTPSAVAPEAEPAPEPTSTTEAREEIAGVTVTTGPAPSTTLRPAPPDDISAFAMSSDRFVEEWNRLLRSLGSPRSASVVSSSDEAVEFEFGEYMELTGVVGSEGTISEITLVGDPSGPVSADREILTALGSVVALVEPDLPPEGRRDLFAALGLDVEDPDLAGLNGERDYGDASYSLRWDPEVERLIFSVSASP